jgi:hypothetical protein
MKRPAIEKFSAGVSSADITPAPEETDAYSAGPPKFERRFPGGVTAPLLAKALATRAGDRTILLLSNKFPGPYEPNNPRRIVEAFIARLNARYRAG